jgi:8-oxo-dGTP pyrophosphatase MutT (NUDIX family)
MMRDSFNGVLAVVFRKEEPRFLLIHNKGTGNITFVAGARKRRESTSLDTLRRELREETGMEFNEYTVERTPFIHEFTYNKRKRLRRREVEKQLVFLIEKKSKKRLNPIDPDSVIHGWFAEKQVLKELTFNDLKELFKKVVKLIEK